MRRRKVKGFETDFDLSRLADDAGQPEELLHESFELVHSQLGAVAATVRTKAAAAKSQRKLPVLI